ncbi:MAG: hypothetical protein LBR16_03455 [Treponema sp.]|jgi:predicted Zn-dependent protease|nr:hypothetical protein [Treponema sp.]
MTRLRRGHLPRRLSLCCALLALAGRSLAAQTRPDALQEYRSGRYQTAVNICRQEIAANPLNIESHVVLCWSLIALGQYQDAAPAAEAARKLNRYDSRVIEIFGELAYYEGRNREALGYFQDYVSQYPEGMRIDKVYYLEGETYIRLERFRHADIALSAAVHRSPGNAVWWTRLAYAREKAGDAASAADAYSQALSLNPSLADAQRGLDRIREGQR